MNKTTNKVVLVDSATGGSKSGPPVLSTVINVPFTAILPLAMLVSVYRGVVTLDYSQEWLSHSPSFWPAATELPTIPMESKSDSGLLSMQDEAKRCWVAAQDDMQRRNEWLSLLGLHASVRNQLSLPFKAVALVVSIPNLCNDFIVELCEHTMYPELRLLGYQLLNLWLAGKASRRVCSKWRYSPVGYAGHTMEKRNEQWAAASFLDYSSNDEKLVGVFQKRPAWAL
jgi:hypothetical protein